MAIAAGIIALQISLSPRMTASVRPVRPSKSYLSPTLACIIQANCAPMPKILKSLCDGQTLQNTRTIHSETPMLLSDADTTLILETVRDAARR